MLKSIIKRDILTRDTKDDKDIKMGNRAVKTGWESLPCESTLLWVEEGCEVLP